MGIHRQRLTVTVNHLRFHLIHLVCLLLAPSLAWLPDHGGKVYPWSLDDRALRVTATSTSDANDADSRSNGISTPGRHPQRAQIRQKPHQRRPRNYWTDVSNIRHELEELWQWANVTIIPPDSPPPIPNESLLNYWKRHDLRAAIATHGGRELLAESLGGALIVPGKWNLAVQTALVQQLVAQDPQLSAEAPPLSPQQQKQFKKRLSQATTANKTNEAILNSPNHQLRWQHSNDRKPTGYWSSQAKVIQELYQFLKQRSQQENIPEAWMPRLADITSQGRDNLALAIRRFGGPKVIARQAGLVPFREWNYLEGMHELLLQLKAYLDQHHGGDYTVFPIASHVKQQGYDRLYSLIQYYGGVKFLSARLDMDTIWCGKKRRSAMDRNQLLAADMNWGPFDLEFGIELYAFVREQQFQQTPPLKHPEIRIPSQLTLLDHGTLGLRLDAKIQEYGGYENVARRLGLAFAFQPF